MKSPVGRELDETASHVESAEISPEQRRVYGEFAKESAELFKSHSVSRHNGIEAMNLGLADTDPSERTPVVGVSRKLGSSFSEIPKDVPISEWGDYISDMGAIGQKTKENVHMTFIEASLPFRADYELHDDGTVSRSLFDADSNEQIDFQPLAPVNEVESLNMAMPHLVDVNWDIGSARYGGVPPAE